ncbi:alpha/beta hydrolase family protein [Flavihumibacter stibioxidans]|uniref:Acetyl xylan esterase domain-containing protein n=1 Tax=Flavihumibacter stibioxidans TaxID=1834163 RepID=A0ABR7M8Y0_9BACT|nr:acetylxylan esterase [Flavihumibacter stibioxidans]MBC6491479.1 hypothetical protein [Flavihumibacter stibioxidans]
MYIDISTNNQGQLGTGLPEEPDEICDLLKKEATRQFTKHKIPATRQEWSGMKDRIYDNILKKAGIAFFPELDFDEQVTGRSRVMNYSIKNIYFQTLPGVYATGNLYIPDGDGPFPAVINFHGHILDSKLNHSVQKRAHILARNGFACFCMDTFGTGERSIKPDDSDYHGGMDGANHFNNGQSLLGIQVSENMRIVDFLSSLDFIDKNNIGATGESGGGNQAMWLAAIDKRIKAAMPVVSVGTFEAFVMAHNCVCETLPDGLTFCEESQILGLIAPRALNVCNALQEKHKAFTATEMLRTVKNTGKIYRLVNASENFHVQIFNNEHEYSKEMQFAMINWFNSHLKENEKQGPVNLDTELLEKEELKVFQHKKRDSKIISQPDYLRITSNSILSQKKFSGNAETELQELKKIVRIQNWWSVEKTNEQSLNKNRILKSICTDTGIRIPVIFQASENESDIFIISADPDGKETTIDKACPTQGNAEKVSFDLLGTGELSSPVASFYDNEITPFHTLSRTLIWLGKTVVGEWIKEFKVILDLIRKSKPDATLRVSANREAGVAAILLSALYPGIDELILCDSLVSYVYEEKPEVEYFNMSITLPGIIPWGDLVHAMALSHSKISITNPRNLHGKILTEDKKAALLEKYNLLATQYRSKGSLHFN